MKISRKHHIRRRGAGKLRVRHNPRRRSYASNLTIEEIKNGMAQATGTEHYYKHWMGFNYTDGVHWLAQKANCYWLLDIIGSYQHKLRSSDFQVWQLKVNPDKTAEVTMREDSNLPVKVKQKLEYTDFPVGEIKLYFVNKVLMVPSEY